MKSKLQLVLALALVGLMAGCTRYVEVAPDVVVVDGANHGSVHYVNFIPLWPTYGWSWYGSPGWPYRDCYGWVGWVPCRYISRYYPRHGWSPINDHPPGFSGGYDRQPTWSGAVYAGIQPVISLSPGWQDTSGSDGARAFEERWFDRERSVSGVPVLQRRVQPAGVSDPTASMVVRSRSGGKAGSSRTQPPPRQSRPTVSRSSTASRPSSRPPRSSGRARASRNTNRARSLRSER